MRELKTFTVLSLIVIGVIGSTGTVSGSVYGPGRTRTLETVPETDPIKYLAALDRLKVGDTAGALRKSRRAVEQFPHHRSSFSLYFRLLLNEEGNSVGQNWARSHLKQTGDTRLLKSLFEPPVPALSARRQLFQWGLEHGYLTPGTAIDLVRFDIRNNRLAETPKALRVGLRHYPDNVDLRVFKIGYFLLAGKCKEALNLVRNLLQVAPSRPELYLAKSKILKGRNPIQSRLSRERYRSLSSEKDRSELLIPDQLSCRTSR
ncbi:MAG: hypothetical protein ABEK50_08690 [bacterium]